MQNSNPRVTIGLPVFNGEEYLSFAIDSILNQTYTNFQLIISDNASTDRTQEICQAYCSKDNRIRYFRNKYNLGAAPNFNKVFQLSSSEYFKWAAYDDVMAPEFLYKCVDVLDNDPEIVVCFSKAEIINEKGISLGEHEYKLETSAESPIVRFRNNAYVRVKINEPAFHIFGLMRTSILRKTSLHGSYAGSDLVLLSELSLYGKFFEIPEILFFPRYHHEQTWITTIKERDRIHFYDTSLEGKILFPKWQYVFGYLNAVKNSPLNHSEKLYCGGIVMRWILVPEHFRALGKDVFLAGKKFASNALSRPHSATE